MSPTEVSEETRALLVKPAETPLLMYQQAIDARIRVLELAALDPAAAQPMSHEQVRALKSARNSASAACRVPLEVLQEIFLNIPHEQEGFATRPTGAPWINITHVCQYWRTAALGYPELWATITPGKGPYHEEMLERSGDAPLHIHAARTTIRSKNFQMTIKKALAKIERLRSVTLFLNTTDPPKSARKPIPWSWFLEPASAREASKLEELHIASPQTILVPNTAGNDGKLLGCGAPVLRVLSLNIAFESTTLSKAPFDSHLTHLKLRIYGKRAGRFGGGRSSVEGPLVGRIIDALKGMPRLEELSLGLNFALGSSDDSLSVPDQVTMPVLRVLQLQDAGAVVRRLFRVLHLPAVASVDIDLEDPTSINSFHQVLLQLKQLLGTPCIPSAGIRYLNLSKWEWTLSAWFDTPRHLSDPSESLDYANMDNDDETQWYSRENEGARLPPLRVLHPEAGADGILAFLAAHFDLSTLRGFGIVYTSTACSTWLEMLAFLPELATLSVCITESDQLVSFLHALRGPCTRQPRGGGIDTNNLVRLPSGSFPSLRKVSVAGFGHAMKEIQLRRKKAPKGRGVEGSSTSCDDIVKAILQTFRSRPLVTQLELWTFSDPGQQEVKAIQDIRLGLPAVQVTVRERSDLDAWLPV